MHRKRYTRRLTSLARRLGIGHNPLRRTGDRAEIALLLTAVVLAVATLPVALSVGLTAQQHNLAVSATQTAARHPVTAVLTEEAPLIAAEYGGIGGILVHASWHGPNGAEHTGIVPAAHGAAAGTRVQVWNDNAGNLVSPPVTPSQADARGMLTVVGLMAAVIAVLAALFAFARTRLERVRAAAWTADWQRTGPQWTTHVNGPKDTP